MLSIHPLPVCSGGARLTPRPITHQQYFTTGYAQTVRLFQGVNDELAGNLIEMVEEIGPIKPITELVRLFSTALLVIDWGGMWGE